MAGERGLATRAVRRHPVILDQQALVVDLLQRPPQALDVGGVHGAVGPVEIHPVAHPLAHPHPGVHIGEYRLAAALVERGDAVVFDLRLAGQAEGLLDLQLHRQPVAVPPGAPRDVVALHRAVAGEGVLERPGLHVVDAGRAVRRRRAFVEDPPGPVRGLGQAAPEDVPLPPPRQDLTLHRGKIDPGRQWFVHGRTLLTAAAGHRWRSLAGDGRVVGCAADATRPAADGDQRRRRCGARTPPPAGLRTGPGRRVAPGWVARWRRRARARAGVPRPTAPPPAPCRPPPRPCSPPGRPGPGWAAPPPPPGVTPPRRSGAAGPAATRHRAAPPPGTPRRAGPTPGHPAPRASPARVPTPRPAAGRRATAGRPGRRRRGGPPPGAPYLPVRGGRSPGSPG